MGNPPPIPSSPGTNKAANPPRGGWSTVSIPGFGEVPLPPLALYCLAVLAVIGAAIHVYGMWRQVRQDLSNNQQILDQIRRVQAGIEVQLANKHYNDVNRTELTVWQNATGRLIIDYYNNDATISVTRYSVDTTIPPTTHWILDLTNVPLQPSPGNTSGGHLSGALDERQHPPRTLFANAVLDAATSASDPSADTLGEYYKSGATSGTPSLITSDGTLIPMQRAQAGCSGHCLNPHPGQFRTWNGQVNGCFVQVWRQWADGCTHYEWFNTCYNYWDPQIWWTCCVH